MTSSPARLGLALVSVLALLGAACGTDDASTTSPVTATSVDQIASTDDEGTTSMDGEKLADELATLPTLELSDADRDGLIFMREEEKLALDVYRELYEIWGAKIFDTISGAEQTHTDSVKTLLDRYDIADPALDQSAGVFTNPDLQTLFDDLVEQGRESLVQALLVGALIEDLDIADLQARASDNEAIALVYSNLERGSRNHLRAFIRQLEANGGTYTPAYISPEEFDTIVSSPTERGGRHGSGGGRP